jgi:hypothetical protein
VSEQEKIRIHELVVKSLEGTLTQEECRELESAIAADPGTRVGYYSQCVDICLGLTKIQQIISDPLHMTYYLQKMAEYERNAEIIPFQKEHSQRQEPLELKPVVYPSRSPSRTSLYVAMTTIAALVLMLLYVYLIPRPITRDVATLMDSMNARWADPATAMKVGTRLWTNQGSVILKEGIIAIQYDDGVEATIQAPAEFELLTPTEIAVSYGRVYAKVSDAGKGFTVKTRNSRVIDLGTEFGVLADVQGDTQLHVYKGKTRLIADGQRNEKKNIEVPAGRAMELQNTVFARQINSHTGLVWNGENIVDLVDVLGGGDGLNGRQTERKTAGQDIFDHPMLGPKEFMPVRNNLFVEGIFVPNGVQGPIPVTRNGKMLWNAPGAEVRQKIGYIRFDISGVQGDRTGAEISFNISSWEGKALAVRVYGLRDGTADLWDESQVCYDNAPGFLPSPLGRYTLNLKAVEDLGTISFKGLGVKKSLLSSLNLDSFIGKDTNGLLTFILICESGDPGDDWEMTTKEGKPSLAPKLTLPFAAGQVPVEITTAQGRGADTYLSNDNQYASTGPDRSHGTESVIKIRDYSKDPVYISDTPIVRLDENLAQTQTTTGKTAYDLSGNNPMIGIRGIGGITFDLRRIQSYYPKGLSFKSFTAVCGMPDTAAKSARAGFYVLVDGQERFSKKNMAPGDTGVAIEVKLTEQDSYLTLAVTGGIDRKSSRDWCCFACPRLNMEQ